MENEEANQRNGIDLIELYKSADENHRFYVAKRLTIITLYFPLMTLILSGIYALVGLQYQVLPCILGIVLTLFLYSLANRNWILSNICTKMCKDIGRKKINADNNLHLKFAESYRAALPEGSTFLDRLIRRIANTQHKAVSIFTVFLLVYWLSLAIILYF